MISFGGLFLCAVGFFSPLTFYHSSDRDCLRLRFAEGGAGIAYDGGTDAIDMTSLSGKLIGGVLGFRSSFKGGWRTRNISAPPWILCPLLAVYPFALLIRRPLRRWRRIRAGLCLKCGYNLTGNVTGLCSECGTPIFRKTELFDASKSSGEQT